MKDKAKATIEAHSGDLIELSQWMYDNPEIAFEEHNSSARLAGYSRVRTDSTWSIRPTGSRPPLSPEPDRPDRKW